MHDIFEKDTKNRRERFFFLSLLTLIIIPCFNLSSSEHRHWDKICKIHIDFIGNLFEDEGYPKDFTRRFYLTLFKKRKYTRTLKEEQIKNFSFSFFQNNERPHFETITLADGTIAEGFSIYEKNLFAAYSLQTCLRLYGNYFEVPIEQFKKDFFEEQIKVLTYTCALKDLASLKSQLIEAETQLKNLKKRKSSQKNVKQAQQSLEKALNAYTDQKKFIMEIESTNDRIPNPFSVFLLHEYKKLREDLDRKKPLRKLPFITALIEAGLLEQKDFSPRKSTILENEMVEPTGVEPVTS